MWNCSKEYHPAHTEQRLLSTMQDVHLHKLDLNLFEHYGFFFSKWKKIIPKIHNYLNFVIWDKGKSFVIHN